MMKSYILKSNICIKISSLLQTLLVLALSIYTSGWHSSNPSIPQSKVISSLNMSYSEEGHIYVCVGIYVYYVYAYTIYIHKAGIIQTTSKPYNITKCGCCLFLCHSTKDSRLHRLLIIFIFPRSSWSKQ